MKPLQKPTQLQPDQIIAVNWIVEKENSLVKGGLFADDCGTGKVRPCCALDILFATCDHSIWHSVSFTVFWQPVYRLHVLSPLSLHCTLMIHMNISFKIYVKVSMNCR